MIKKLIPAYILSFVIAFIVFIHEPIMLYASNMDDLWFDFMTMIKPSILLFFIFFALLVFIYTLVKLISRKDHLYNLVLVISFIVLFASYIQGNYMLKKLPALDGTTIVWKGFLVQNIITAIVWIILITTYIIVIKKFGIKKIIDVSWKISLAIFIMLFVSSASTLMTTKKVFMSKQDITSMKKYYSDFSSDRNFIIFLVDAVDSKKFATVLKDTKYKNMLNDFTYYPDTLAYYPYTKQAIPLILTGQVSKNEDDYYTYYNKAFDKSPLLNRLNKENYNINIYDNEFKWVTKKSVMVTNAVSTTRTVKLVPFAKNELKYVAYKYLPFAFKRFVHIEKMDFTSAKTITNDEPYIWNNIHNYALINENQVNITKEKRFKFIHTSGAHVPFVEDEELHWVDEKESSYTTELKSTMKLIDAYFNMLKDNDIYDNSVIILMADHGYMWKEDGTRFNPILYIKGINEKSDKMRISNKRVSQTDFMDAYDELLDGKKSESLFKNISDNRKRNCVWYEYTKENHMIEYIQTGNAWDNKTLSKTGREFNR